MALLKPTFLPVPAFDAIFDNVFQFSVPSGGDQVTQNRLTITNQVTGIQVYQQTVTSFIFNHTVPANTLQNGQYYSAYFNTYNSTGEISADSNIIQFRCYTTPTFIFTNIPPSGFVTNSSFNFSMRYNQTEGELLNSYVVNLYDAQNVLVSTSGVKYVGSITPPPTDLNYEFGGLLDQTSYYIQAKGQTIYNTEIITALTPFTTQYEKPSVFAVVELTQNCQGGYVTVKSNLVDIEGKSYPSPPVYVDDDTAVDLRPKDYWVMWDTGYDLSNNFKVSVWGRDFNPNKTLISFKNSNNDTITIRYFENDIYNGITTVMAYVDCVVKSGNSEYYVYSNFIPLPLATETVQFILTRINNIYQLDLYKL